jgi:hypothetical protein
LSIPERLFRISKAYLNQVRDRIDAELAERELEASLDRDPDLPDRDDASPEAMMRRAEARIAAARRDMERQIGERTPGAAPVPAPPVEIGAQPATVTAPAAATKTVDTYPNAADFRVLGVPVGSDLPTVQAAYEKLSRRCDPRRFPEGSNEQKEADRILARVNVAYDALRKRLDPTENRFGKLELE